MTFHHSYKNKYIIKIIIYIYIMYKINLIKRLIINTYHSYEYVISFLSLNFFNFIREENAQSSQDYQ